MIAIQSLKYKIFEWCLDILVDKLLTNFTLLPIGSEIKIEDLTKGMKLSKIEIITNKKIIYYGCNIVYLNHIGKISFNNDIVDDVYDISFSFCKRVPKRVPNLVYDLEDGENDHKLGLFNDNVWWMVRADKPNIKFFL